MDTKMEIQLLKRTETLTRHWIGANHISLGPKQQLHLTFNLDGQTLKIIKRLPTPDASVTASNKSCVKLNTLGISTMNTL